MRTKAAKESRQPKRAFRLNDLGHTKGLTAGTRGSTLPPRRPTANHNETLAWSDRPGPVRGCEKKKQATLFLVALFAVTLSTEAFGLTFQVNNTGDASDVAPGDGICDSDAMVSGAQCSLRAAIEEANAHAGSDVVTFIVSNNFGGQSGIPTIGVTQALPDLSSNITISGPGPRELVLQRVGAAGYRIFNVTTASAVTISGLTLSGGDRRGVDGYGGGIVNSNSAVVNITDCLLRDNTATFGGAIANVGAGAITVTRCTLTGNSANRWGGAVYVGNGETNFFNCTVNGNVVTAVGDVGGLGGGFYIFGGMLNIVGCTVSGNTAGLEGGGIFADARIVRIKNSIVALNTAMNAGPDLRPRNFGSGFDTQGFNLIGKNDTAEFNFPAGNPNANRDIVGTSAAPIDPLLDSSGPTDHGGPTPTIALLAGSPAIDKAISTDGTLSLTTEQRGVGYLRTIDNATVPNASGGDGTDIGAFELGAHLPMVSRKRHGGTDFDIDLAADGNPTIECRSGGLTSDYQLVLTFPGSVTIGGNPQARVTSGMGQVGVGGTANGGAVSIVGSTVTVPLTNIANAQALGVTLFAASNGVESNNISISMRVLSGDPNGNGNVSASDVSQAKAQVAQPVTAANFRTDINASGTINASDIAAVKAQVGTSLP